MDHESKLEALRKEYQEIQDQNKGGVYEPDFNWSSEKEKGLAHKALDTFFGFLSNGGTRF